MSEAPLSRRFFLLGVAASILLHCLGFFEAGKLSPASAQATEHSPHVCLGMKGDNSWRSKEGFELCPAGFAVLAANLRRYEYVSRLASGPMIGVSPVCCRLPANDILLDIHEEVADSCPEDFVATGAQHGRLPKGERFLLRCTKINTKRYQLGETRFGAYWGSGGMIWKNKLRFLLTDIPPALRFALGRLDKYRWQTQGCVGYPFGSILVEKAGKRCDDLYYRELQFRGAKGDPAAGTPIEVLPKCEEISDKFDPNARCL